MCRCMSVNFYCKAPQGARREDKEVQGRLRKRGEPLPTADLMIAAMTINNDMTLVTLDEHFQVIRKVEPRLRLATGDTASTDD